MLRLAARECDGVMLHSFCSRHYLTETILPLIEETLQRLGNTGVTSKSRVVGCCHGQRRGRDQQAVRMGSLPNRILWVNPSLLASARSIGSNWSWPRTAGSIQDPIMERDDTIDRR